MTERSRDGDSQRVTRDFGSEPYDGLEVEFCEEGEVDLCRLAGADEPFADESKLGRRDEAPLRRPDSAEGDAAPVCEGESVPARDGLDRLAGRRGHALGGSCRRFGGGARRRRRRRLGRMCIDDGSGGSFFGICRM